MNCPKCKSSNVSDGTTGTQHCDDCDYSWLPYNTAPRFTDAGAKKSKPEPIGNVIVLMVLVVLIAIALGFVSPLVAIVVGALGLLAGILYYVAQIAARSK
jgi:uncharacterized membrane protein